MYVTRATGVGRGNAPGSRRTQFKRRPEVESSRPSTPQQKHQSKAFAAARRRAYVETVAQPDRAAPTSAMRVQAMVDNIYDVKGRAVRKSLIGMAQKLGASADDIRRIYSASESDLERAYYENKLVFETYWEYPVIEGDDRGAELEDILRTVGV